MGIINLIKEKMRESRERQTQKLEELQNTPDEVTRDNHLRSLRRERRTQLEEIEKDRLKRQIDEFKKERTIKYMYGIKNNNPKPIKKPIRKISNNLGFFKKGKL